jgi:uncharacterized membrane protein YfcA
MLYSSVGHGGASAYLAAMAFFGVAPAAMRPAALVMNVVVAAVGVARFAAAGAVPWATIAPLCAASVPAAFLGGMVAIRPATYQPLLAAALLLAAWRLWAPAHAERARRAPPVAVWLALGAGFGTIAGLTGIGGGVFLSPVLILSGWETPRRTAGAAVTFILLNSIAGLLGQLASAARVPAGSAVLCVAALAGGTVGSWLGAQHLAPVAMRRVLAVVLVIAGGKLLAGG